MNEKIAGSIKYYQFKSYENHGLYHAVFTRQGGVSPKPWKSLNFGASVGDDIERVQKNKRLALSSVGIKTGSIFDVYQVHSTEVVQTELPLQPGDMHIKADAIITNKPGVTLLMRFADCVPILLFDPVKRAIGIVHAGWMGTLNKIVTNAVARMKGSYGTNPGDLIACIGPSIGPDHYRVKDDVLERFEKVYGKLSGEMIRDSEGAKYLDLWKANKIILIQVGVSRIEIAGICTNCRMEDWYSHRGELGMTGRFGVLFGLLD